MNVLLMFLGRQAQGTADSIPSSPHSRCTRAFSCSSSAAIRACSAFRAANSPADTSVPQAPAAAAVMAGPARPAGAAVGKATSPHNRWAQRASRSPGARGSLTTRTGSRVASSSRKPSTEERSANLCRRSLFRRSSAVVCGPRSISTASNATDCPGRPSRRPRLCSKRTTRLPLPSNTRLRALRPSTAVITSASVASMTGDRAVFWLQPATSAFSDSG